MMVLVKGEDYENLFFDLSALYKKVRNRVPAEAGLFLRPKKLGRRPSPTYGLKLRKKKRKEIKKTGATKRTTAQVSSNEKIVPLDSAIVVRPAEPAEDGSEMRKDFTVQDSGIGCYF
ncbi:hypothetical protein DPMN_168576 [Dreissena polymorpha]|nr:hypothetical protein DPMN_168576 [Dreissena polymorpha]